MIITITNNKGGVGKSTTAQTLSIGLAQRGFKVLLVDLDAQCNTSSTLQVKDDTKNIYQVLKGNISIDDAIIHKTLGNVKLDVISSSLSLIYADDEFKKGVYQYKMHKLVAEQLEHLKDRYNYIIIDTAPNLSLLTTNAIYSSDYILIPMIADIYSIEGLKIINQQIEDLKSGTDNKRVKILGILLTNYKAQTLSNQMLKDALLNIATQINTKVYKNTIRDSIIFSDSQLSNNVCLLKYPNHNATQDYKGFIKEFIKDTNKGDN
jgi:chromosome partitioning protein